MVIRNSDRTIAIWLALSRHIRSVGWESEQIHVLLLTPLSDHALSLDRREGIFIANLLCGSDRRLSLSLKKSNDTLPWGA